MENINQTKKNFKKNKLIIFKLVMFFCVLFQIQMVSAQSSIKGIIVNEKGEALSNVSVMLKGTKKGVVTDDKGFYSFTVPKGTYNVATSLMGYQQEIKKVKVNFNEHIIVDFKLKQATEELDDVVVKGYLQKEQIVLESQSATKSKMSLMVTPAPIVAINRGLLDQQGITNLQEAIRNLSGVTQAGNNYNIGDNLIIRGLDANFTLDGMYSGAGLGNDYNPTRSLTNIERIEVLKGPATGLYGIGSAGGVINFVEKKPEFTKKGLVEITAGQWNSYRGMLDYTAPISDKFAYRVVGAAEISDGYRDVSMDRYEIYGSLRFKSSGNVHNLTLSAAAIHDSYDIDAIGDPVRLISPDLLDDFDWTSLINDTTLNDDGTFTGLQLTDTQRQILASSLLDSDGVTPYDIGDHSLMYPSGGKSLAFRRRL